MNRKSKTFTCKHSSVKIFGIDIIVYCKKCKSEIISCEETKKQEKLARILIAKKEVVTTEKIKRLLDK